MNRVDGKSHIYTAFGKLINYYETDEALIMINEDGIEIRKSKKYGSWTTTKAKLERFKNHNVFYRTKPHHIYDADNWFTDVYIDEGFFSDASLPSTKAEAHSRILTLHTQMANIRDYNDRREAYTNQQLEELEQAKKRAEEAFETLPPKDKAQVEIAIEYLDNNWGKLIEEGNGSLIIAGQQWTNAKEPKPVDKRFALRYGIDVTNLQRIDVEYVERIEKTNNIVVKVPRFEDREIIVGIVKGNRKATYNKLCITSVFPKKDAWYNQEEKLVNKDAREPIGYFLDGYAKINRLVDLPF